MKSLLEDAAQRSIHYLEGLPSRSVAPTPAAVAGLASLQEPLPTGSTPPAEVLRILDETCSAATLASAGPRFFGFVIGGSLPAALAANWLSAAWDQNAALYNATPASATLENIALGWLVELFGLPAGTGGAFVTGATMANFTALAAARHAVLAKVGWNVEADGLFGAPPITVVVGDEVHTTMLKSLGLVGFGRSRLVRVPVDRQGRIRAEAFPKLSGPAIVCLQAGNVNSGAFDPLQPLIEQAHDAGAWVHVDGAFGLWALAAPERAHLAAGILQADSWGTDAHKWLNVPYDSGLTFVREPANLAAAMAVTAEYLPTSSPNRNPSDYTPELSRRGRGVEVWAALRSLGRQGVAELVEGCCRHATRFAEGLQAAGYEVLNEVVLNQVVVSFGDAERNRRVIEAIQQDGTCWAGGTVWQGRSAMRISVSSWATSAEDVEISLDAILRVAHSV